MLTSVVLLLVGSDNCVRYPNAKKDEDQKRYKETPILDIEETPFIISNLGGIYRI